MRQATLRYNEASWEKHGAEGVTLVSKHGVVWHSVCCGGRSSKGWVHECDEWESVSVDWAREVCNMERLGVNISIYNITDIRFYYEHF